MPRLETKNEASDDEQKDDTPDDAPKDEKSNIEGLLAFLYEMLAYAAGAYSVDTYRLTLTARLYNGMIRADGVTKKAYRMHILVPGYNKITQIAPSFTGEDRTETEMPFAPASIPPAFVLPAWSFILLNF